MKRSLLMSQYNEYVKNNNVPFEMKTNVRIMTFNVEGFKQYDGILDVVRESDADIIGLNEALFFTDVLREKFKTDVTNLGYHIVMCNIYGINVILSKYQIKKHKVIKLIKDPIKNRNRYALKVDIDGINILLTHLDAFDNSGTTRLNQIRQILNNVDSTYILMGDMNSTTESEVVNTISESFIDSFDLLNKQSPEMTSWIGKQIDYIYIGKDFPYHVTNSNVHCSTVSDHFPVYIDL